MIFEPLQGKGPSSLAPRVRSLDADLWQPKASDRSNVGLL
jgi:hypothetical protein